MAQLLDFTALNTAVADDAIDRAIELGLLDWDGDARPAITAGLDAAAIARLQQVRQQRLDALAARERHRLRAARMDRLADERKQRQAESVASDTATGTPALAGAAAAALARALAKAKR
ncbi:MAG: hypothetical protein Q4G62_05075 [Pseudomonadota bacterium]|nr:hypothetical protein [Pseudomonadota bacterium]